MRKVKQSAPGFEVHETPKHHSYLSGNTKIWDYKAAINFQKNNVPWHVPVVISLFKRPERHGYGAFVSVPQHPAALAALSPFRRIWGAPVNAEAHDYGSEHSIVAEFRVKR
ncbi:MAG TPA: hypothetical protein VGQ00_02245 [Candidatus Norongarragalinales archaeon]|nr:hypothetical protein [Candidatus Norongarragalinales archaeon]